MLNKLEFFHRVSPGNKNVMGHYWAQLSTVCLVVSVVVWPRVKTHTQLDFIIIVKRNEE